jgi:crotonobetainyl-CoA:carnitine CoA-transferase CaiB-like acyl-CoA transferase
MDELDPTAGPADPPGPLAGIRVVDVTQMISGPLATMLLADQGADVIKVEPPGIAPTFATSNHSKRSIALDLKQPQALAALDRLVARADVFVQNLRPGKAETLGIGEPRLRGLQPRLVYVSISGFGESGPYAHKRVYDPVIQALSGLADIQADRESGRPRMVRVIIPDKITALTAAQAICAALVARERQGVGQHVRLAMLDATVSLLWPEGMARQTFLADADRLSRPALAQDLVFETADGYLTTGAVSDAEWRGLAEALEHPEWLDDPRFRTPASRIRHVEARLALTADALKGRTTAEWLERLDARQVPCAPVLRREDLAQHPQIRENALLIESEHPSAGRMREPRPAARFDRTPARIRRPAPALGQHTDELLGYGPAEIAALRASGAAA